MGEGQWGGERWAERLGPLCMCSGTDETISLHSPRQIFTGASAGVCTQVCTTSAHTPVHKLLRTLYTWYISSGSLLLHLMLQFSGKEPKR